MTTVTLILSVIAVVLAILSFIRKPKNGDTCPMGMQGPTGAKGDRGEPGPKGDPGENGDHGKDGKDGKYGKSGVITKGTITGKKIIDLLQKEDVIDLSKSAVTAKSFMQSEEE